MQTLRSHSRATESGRCIFVKIPRRFIWFFFTPEKHWSNPYPPTSLRGSRSRVFLCRNGVRSKSSVYHPPKKSVQGKVTCKASNQRAVRMRATQEEGEPHPLLDLNLSDQVTYRLFEERRLVSRPPPSQRPYIQ